MNTNMRPLTPHYHQPKQVIVFLYFNSHIIYQKDLKDRYIDDFPGPIQRFVDSEPLKSVTTETRCISPSNHRPILFGSRVHGRLPVRRDKSGLANHMYNSSMNYLKRDRT